MSGDFISREAVLAQKGDCYDKDGHLLYAVGTGNILRIPAADVVEVVRGKWEMNSNYPDRFICSECGAQFDCWHWEAKQMHYCPSCGAKMDGGQDDGQT